MKHEIKTRSRVLRKRQTQAEKLLWQRLRNRQLVGLKFLRQHPIVFHENGLNHYFIADFYCYKLKLVIELDGDIHLLQKEYDAMRDSVITGMNLKVVRFTNDEIINDIDKISKILESFS